MALMCYPALGVMLKNGLDVGGGVFGNYDTARVHQLLLLGPAADGSCTTLLTQSVYCKGLLAEPFLHSRSKFGFYV